MDLIVPKLMDSAGSLERFVYCIDGIEQLKHYFNATCIMFSIRFKGIVI